MARPAKSQWNFGELFTPEQTRSVLSVSDLTTQVKRLLEKQVGTVWVTGEITNLRSQSSGHIYFTLKDAGAQLACVLFRGEPVSHRNLLQDGQKVVLQGDVTVYEARGQYQMIVRAVEMQGIGALQAAFEKLKQKLSDEGLFAPERKRALPRMPQRIGLVTSPTGAAIRDVLTVIERRQPWLEIILAPCRVQGVGAAQEIADAIKLLNEWAASAPDARPALDLILVTRGGGSLEDLWAFNEEVVARAIHASALPVVSAVGHEIDFTISDFVADLRAPTPSAGAEIITEAAFASRELVADASGWLHRRVHQRMERERENLEVICQRLQRRHPRRQIQEHYQRLDDLQAGLARVAAQRLREAQTNAAHLSHRLLRLQPGQRLQQSREQLAQACKRFVENARAALQARQQALAHLETRLRLLSPEQTLARGYSITSDAVTGRILRHAAEVKPGQVLATRLAQGAVRSVAQENVTPQ
ncbi:MAG: exodeoxyribonuclease VII large subunit [Verrucomicrobiota bacterium]